MYANLCNIFTPTQMHRINIARPHEIRDRQGSSTCVSQTGRLIDVRHCKLKQQTETRTVTSLRRF